MQKPFLSREQLRYYELVAGIVDYCSDWVEEEDGVEEPRTMPADESLSVIESYGVPLVTPNEYLVCNAIRHLLEIVNPWNKEDLWGILEEQCGFTPTEIERYRNIDCWQQYRDN